jgi:hypothetical protein
MATQVTGITIDQAVDLGYATLQSFDQDDFAITLKHPRYEAINQWFRKDKVQLDGGDRVTRYIQLRDANNAQHVRLYQTDQPNATNTDEEIQVEWTHAITSFTYSRKELAMNLGNKVRVYNYLKSRRMGAFREFADLLEEAAWVTPTDANDDLNPHGIPAWLSYGAASSAGFIGYSGHYNDGAGTTYNSGTIASSSTSNPRWANYWDDHEGNVDDTLLDKLSRAFRKCHFQAPLEPGKIFSDESFTNFRLYSNDNVIGEMEKIARLSDDKIGPDLGKYQGRTVFKGIPFVYVDVLDTANTYVYGTDPIFGVDHNQFYPVVLRGEYFRINKPMSQVGQHNVLTVYVDLSYAYICENRRQAGFLISYSANY